MVSNTCHEADPTQAPSVPPLPTKLSSFDSVIACVNEDDEVDDLVHEWARLKLETNGLRDLCQAAQAGLAALVSSNGELHAALRGSATARGGSVVVVEELSDVEEDEHDGVDQDGHAEEDEDRDEDEEDDEEEPVYRSLAVPSNDDATTATCSGWLSGQPVRLSHSGSSDDDRDEDEEAPVYRSLAVPSSCALEPPAPFRSRSEPPSSGPAREEALRQMDLKIAGGKRQRSNTSEITASVLQPAKHTSDATSRSSPTQRTRKLAELKETIERERREHTALIATCRENEARIARLRAERAELLRELTALRESVP